MFAYSEVIAKGTPTQHQRSGTTEESPSFSEWIRNFTAQHDWLCVVDDDYVNDNFNHYGLSSIIEDYNTALKVVRGQTSSGKGSHSRAKLAESLYGLMHARYLLTFQGIKEMRPKYEKRIFGTCPRVACAQQALLPIGLAPMPGEKPVKTFCPCCEDIYDTDCELDGAFFGPYFPHLFVQLLKSDSPVHPKVSSPLSIFGVPIDFESPMYRSKFIH
jgi:casein kinase II subunit beta